MPSCSGAEGAHESKKASGYSMRELMLKIASLATVVPNHLVDGQ
jgi:hypothetical protein